MTHWLGHWLCPHLTDTSYNTLAGSLAVLTPGLRTRWKGPLKPVFPLAPATTQGMCIKISVSPLQDMATNPSSCWLFVMFLATAKFSRLPLLSEHVNYSQTNSTLGFSLSFAYTSSPISVQTNWAQIIGVVSCWMPLLPKICSHILVWLGQPGNSD
ncbi:hypothetical protein BsWGS_28241 [Bradybaena similaris]